MQMDGAGASEEVVRLRDREKAEFKRLLSENAILNEQVAQTRAQREEVERAQRRKELEAQVKRHNAEVAQQQEEFTRQVREALVGSSC